jgi:hypothetical protein
MKPPEFNLFSDKSAWIFLIFPSICLNFHGFPKFGGGQFPPCPPVSYAYVYIAWPVGYMISFATDL